MKWIAILNLIRKFMNYILNQSIPATLAIGDSVTARVKSAVESESDAPAKQSQLSIHVEAGATYQVEAWLPFSLAGVESGYNFRFYGPAASAVFLRSQVTDGDTKEINKYVQGAAITSEESGITDDLGVAGDHELDARGEIKFTAAGEFYVGFSQNNKTLEAPITLKAGGFLRLTKVA